MFWFFETATHALIAFVEEKCTAVIPLDRVTRVESVKAGEECIVTWHDRKQYNAVFILSGKFHCFVHRFYFSV